MNSTSSNQTNTTYIYLYTTIPIYLILLGVLWYYCYPRSIKVQPIIINTPSISSKTNNIEN